MTGGLFKVGAQSPGFGRHVRLGAVQRCIATERTEIAAGSGDERKLNRLLFAERRIHGEFAIENVARALAVPA